MIRVLHCEGQHYGQVCGRRNDAASERAIGVIEDKMEDALHQGIITSTF
jgi:hypothetical protein